MNVYIKPSEKGWDVSLEELDGGKVFDVPEGTEYALAIGGEIYPVHSEDGTPTGVFSWFYDQVFNYLTQDSWAFEDDDWDEDEDEEDEDEDYYHPHTLADALWACHDEREEIDLFDLTTIPALKKIASTLDDDALDEISQIAYDACYENYAEESQGHAKEAAFQVTLAFFADYIDEGNFEGGGEDATLIKLNSDDNGAAGCYFVGSGEEDTVSNYDFV